MTSTTSTITGSTPSIKFYTKTWTPTIPVIASVCFVHGFIEHIERYNHVFEAFAKEGIAVFGFDQRGFGATATFNPKSQGVTSWSLALNDIDYFISHTSTLFPNVPLYLFGHSMGGGEAIAYATKSQSLNLKNLNLIKGVLVSGPLLRQTTKTSGLVLKLGSLLGSLSPSMTIKTVVKPADVCRDPIVQEAYAKDPLCAPIGTFKGVSDMILGGENLMVKDYKNWPQSLPFLLAHGSGDKVTSHDASELFVEQLKKDGKDAEFKSFEGFYHELVQEPGEDKWSAINYFIEWIKSKATPTPTATTTTTAAAAATTTEEAEVTPALAKM